MRKVRGVNRGLRFGTRYHPHPKFLPYPAKHVSIRGAEEEKYTLVDITKGAPKILEEIEFSRALFEVYEGGVVWPYLILTLPRRLICAV